LEGSSELSGIQSQLMRSTILCFNGGVLDRGVSSVGSPVNESSIGSVSIVTQISSGNVVSQSESTVAVGFLDAGFITSFGHGNVDSVQITVVSGT